ncbi:oxygenase MpaB family protein [Nocardia sp. NPDC051052]|uniref:oxygenase MpaB family protein n=1 Tax=Nocardia sp. NPDC051052 TaxID=3364322 RepID=UPI0037A3D673
MPWFETATPTIEAEASMDAIARRAVVNAQPLGPGCEAWRLAADRTVVLQGASSLLMQVAHPIIAAAVIDHSTTTDLVGRLNRTIASIWRLIYGGPAAAGESQRLFEMHKAMKGIDANGNRYHALHPEAYAWVLATLFDGLNRYYVMINSPISESDRERLYQDWRQLAELLGLRPWHLPADLAGFEVYYETMIAERLHTNRAFHTMFKALLLSYMSSSPARYLPDSVWNKLRPPASSLVRLCAVGMLRPSARELFELPWTQQDQRRLHMLGTGIRTVNAALPKKARHNKLATTAFRS